MSGIIFAVLYISFCFYLTYLVPYAPLGDAYVHSGLRLSKRLGRWKMNSPPTKKD